LIIDYNMILINKVSRNLTIIICQMENWTRCDPPIKVMKMVFNIMTKEACRKNIRRILLGNGIYSIPIIFHRLQSIC